MIEHYDTLGYVVVGTMAVMIWMMFYINKTINARAAQALATPLTPDIKEEYVEEFVETM